MIKSQELIENHIIFKTLLIPNEIDELLESKSYQIIDEWAQCALKPNGLIYQALLPIVSFSYMESIIAIRTAGSDEEGIWHDDGSRVLGFSLSLTKNHADVAGGHLEFRLKGQNEYLSIPTRPYGTIILFKTGIYGYEHRVSCVTKGERIVIAGWCYE